MTTPRTSILPPCPDSAPESLKGEGAHDPTLLVDSQLVARISTMSMQLKPATLFSDVGTRTRTIFFCKVLMPGCRCNGGCGIDRAWMADYSADLSDPSKCVSSFGCVVLQIKDVSFQNHHDCETIRVFLCFAGGQLSSLQHFTCSVAI
jgi:hypothetical protein